MSRSGIVKSKSIHFWIICVLLVSVLMLSGCSGSGDVSGGSSGAGEGVSDSNNVEQLTGQEITAQQNTLPSAAEVIAEAYSEGETDGDSEAGTVGDNAVMAGQMEGEADLTGGDLSSEGDGSPGDETAVEGDGLLTGPLATVSPESGQDIQEIIVKPARRKSTLPDIYDPNPSYDKYALVEYVIEDIGAEFTATVSAKIDGSEYEVRCTLGRVQQIVILDEEYNVTYDRTGSMGDDAPLIVQKAVSESEWRDIGE